MYRTKRIYFFVVLLVIGAMVLAACGAPAPGAPPASDDGEGMSDSDGAAMDSGEITRAETVFIDESARPQDPELWNWYIPGGRTSNGYFQAMVEPLFILNYESGEMEEWLATSFESNDTLDVWTLTLREGIEWSDGEAYNADDIVFTINMLLENAPELRGSTEMDQWVDNVEKIDDLTVQFNLKEPNPRFVLDHFAVKIGSSRVNFVPEHIWADKDPLTFKFYDPEQGWPVATGPYELVSTSEVEWVYQRRDSWWGAKIGWKELPAPKQLVWTAYGPEETRVAVAAEGEMDSVQDITLGAFQALQAKTNNAFVSWVDGPPFAWLDPCSRTFEMNLSEGHWAEPDMRWALNYYIDRDQIIDIAYENTTIKSEHFFVAYPPLNRYVDLIRDNPLFQEMQITDPAKADALLEGQGWAKNDDGFWEKDGEVLTMQITTHESFIEKQRIAQVLVEQFQANGIDAVHLNEAGSAWGDNHAMGTFDARMGWQTCGSINEPWASMDTMSTRHLKPVGERASLNRWRWSGENADAYSALVEEMGTLPLDDSSPKD
ncbi:ABC transporter substrate-binding protein [Chloroflexi bacterium TSY]|nr:ABC transporter substrate-binding protein [Chloroflexi bacterium TSY]